MNEPRLPKAIADSAAAVDAIEKQLFGSDPAPEPAPAAESPSPAPEPAPVADTPPPADDLTLQRYKSLQGVYNATQRKLDALARDNEALQEQLRQVKSAPPVDAEALQRSLSLMREQLGEELAGAMKHQIQAAVVEAIRQYVEPLKSVVSSSVERDNGRLKEAFYDRLDMLAPKWEALNNDQGFLAWLNQYDPASGTQLSALLKDAEKRLDADRAALFFHTYEREIAGNHQTPAATPMPRTDVAPPPHRPQVRLWKRAEIDQFYLDQQRGKYRGREAEMIAIEQDIINAHREGRIV